MIALLLALQATVTEALPADVSAAAAQTVAQASHGGINYLDLMLKASIPVKPRTTRATRATLDPQQVRELYEQRQWTSTEIAAHLDTIIKSAPVIGPMATAADYVDDALEALHRRNPDLARALNPTKITVHEKLAGAIGKATKDQLTTALQAAGAPAVKP